MSIQTLQKSQAFRVSVATRTSFTFNEPDAFVFSPPEGRERYAVHCYVDPANTRRQDAYQRLRAQIFVNQLGWKIPVDSLGRERDHYDLRAHGAVSSHCVYGLNAATSTEHLLGGVRVFRLRDWNDSMVMNEFSAVGMVPASTLMLLRRTYASEEILELTRFCVQRGRWYGSPSLTMCFNNQIARDLTYATVFAQAKHIGCQYALALADSRYLQVMRRSRFSFREIYVQRGDRQGYALVIIDLWKTIRSIRTGGDQQRADRMLALCAYV